MTKPGLIAVEGMLRVAGLETPRDLYTVLASPAPLAGMPHPAEETPWGALASLGFRHVVCLTTRAPRYEPAPLGLLHAVELEDLYGGLDPVDPEREGREIERTARIVLAALRRSEGVLVHCQGGTGRTGTVIGVVLRGLGYSSAEVVDYLDAIHRARGKRGWP